jgi:hypothetical protein
MDLDDTAIPDKPRVSIMKQKKEDAGPSWANQAADFKPVSTIRGVRLIELDDTAMEKKRQSRREFSGLPTPSFGTSKGKARIGGDMYE